MQWDQVEANWAQYSGSAQAHWAKLTDMDWQQVASNRATLVERIQVRYEVSQETAEQQIDEWLDALFEYSKPAAKTAS